MMAGQMHSIELYNNGHDGYLNLHCESGCPVQELFDFDRIDWLDAADNDFQMKCPECGCVATVKNETQEQE